MDGENLGNLWVATDPQGEQEEPIGEARKARNKRVFRVLQDFTETDVVNGFSLVHE